jgi:hypothetical protein
LVEEAIAIVKATGDDAAADLVLSELGKIALEKLELGKASLRTSVS